MNSPKAKRRWLQFSLRSLLLITLLVALWLGYEVRQARLVEQFAARMTALGGQVECECKGWSLLRFVDRRKYGQRIVKAEIPVQSVGNALPHLKALSHLREVRVAFDGTCDVGASWELVNACLPGVRIVAKAHDHKGTENPETELSNGETTIPPRRLERFRQKVRQGADTTAQRHFSNWRG